MDKKRIYSLVFKGSIIICGVFGVILNCIYSNNIASLLSYYTIQSNIICIILFTVLFFLELFCKKDYKNDVYYLIKSAFSFAILITCLVYNFVLRPQILISGVEYNTLSMADTFVHVITPILIFIDYFVFDIKGKIKWFYPLIWPSIPLLYLVYVAVYNLFGGVFIGFGGTESSVPYFFLDVNTYGIFGVMLWIIGILIIGIAIGYLIYFIDIKSSKKHIDYKNN